MRSHKRNLDLWISVFDPLDQPDIAGKPGSAGVENQKFELLRHLNRLVRRYMVRRGVKQLRPFKHAGRIRQPYWVPVGLDFSSSRPARPGAAVEILKRRRVQKQCFKRHNVLSVYPNIYGTRPIPMSTRTITVKFGALVTACIS